MAHDLGARRATGLARDEGAQLGRIEAVGELRDLGRLARPLAAFKGDEASASGRPLSRDLIHDQSFSAPARNMPITSSLAPSIARRTVEPVPMASAA